MSCSLLDCDCHESLESLQEYSQHDPEDVIALVDDPEVEVEETDDATGLMSSLFLVLRQFGLG